MTEPLSRGLALVLAGLALSACTAREAALGPAAPRYASLDALIEGPRRAAPLRAATPLVVLPDWIGTPTRLRESDRAEAFEQAVSLSPGPRGPSRENLVMLRLVRAEAAEASAGGRPTEAGIRAELAAMFPDTPMQVVTRPAANAYGPYGLAVGRAADGARCLYAWQWIAEAPALDPEAGGPQAVSLRLRLCRGDVTAEALAAAMNQIRLVPRFAGTPVASPRPRPAPVRVAAHRAPTERPRAESPAAEPSRTELPRLESRPEAAPGRRYLGAVQVARPASAGPAQAPGQVSGLAADLPPEALRGPAPSPARP